jgi:tetratricopeptide (TPR) repeat protein
MRRVLSKVVRLPSASWRAARRRPLVAAAVVLALAGAVGVGVWQYALYQWRAAQVALKEDRAAEARDRLAFCLRVWPRSPEVRILAARAARLTGEFPAAEAYLNRALEIDGRKTDSVTAAVQLEFALMRVQTGEVDTPLAVELFNGATADNPDAPMILETLTHAYMIRTRFKLAHGCLTRWIDIEPNNPKPYHLRGMVWERLNNPKQAKIDYDRALELNPDFVKVRLRVVEMHLEDKQAPEALPHLERLMRQAGDDPRVQARMGMCLFLQGQREDARRLMSAAVEHLPDDAPLLIALANLDIQEERGADAEARLRRVLKADPSDTEALFVLASALRIQGKIDEAQAVLTEHTAKRALMDRLNALLKDVADGPTARPSDHAEIGELFIRIGQEKVGVYWLERALEGDPENQRAHKALASYYEKQGDAANGALHRQRVRNPGP